MRGCIEHLCNPLPMPIPPATPATPATAATAAATAARTPTAGPPVMVSVASATAMASAQHAGRRLPPNFCKGKKAGHAARPRLNLASAWRAA